MFADGTRIKRKPEVTYLDCQINQYSNIAQELSKRISSCMTILKRLDIFWRHCEVTVGFKIIALDAVIRAKLLYGLESAQLNPSQQQRIIVFQLKGFRKILKMKTTYVERNNSNAEVFRRADEAIQHETPAGKPQKIARPFFTCYKNSRMKRLARVFNLPDDHPVKQIIFASNDDTSLILPWIPPNRRVGRPRFKWVTELSSDMWTSMASIHPTAPNAFDREGNTTQHDILKETILSVSSSEPAFLFK